MYQLQHTFFCPHFLSPPSHSTLIICEQDLLTLLVLANSARVQELPLAEMVGF